MSFLDVPHFLTTTTTQQTAMMEMIDQETAGLMIRQKIKNLSRLPGVTYEHYRHYLPLFCDKVEIPGLDSDGTTLLLCLAQISNLSAELIAAYINHSFGTKITAEEIWDIHLRWNRNRLRRPFAGDNGFFVLCIGAHGLPIDAEWTNGISGDAEWTTNILGDPKRSVSGKPRPTTVSFLDYEIYEDDLILPLVEGYDVDARCKIMTLLEWCNIKAFHEPTAVERAIIEPLGHPLADILLRRLSEGSSSCFKELEELYPWPHPMINESRIDEIYLVETNFYQNEMACDCRDVFGITDHDRKYSCTKSVSTIDGACELLRRLLVDRCTTIIQRRKFTTEQLGVVPVMDLTDLDEEDRSCKICLQEMVSSNGEPRGPDEERAEKAVRVVFCCGMVFGRACLQKWFTGPDAQPDSQQTCPGCREKVSSRFLKALFSYTEESEAYYDSDGDGGGHIEEGETTVDEDGDVDMFLD